MDYKEVILSDVININPSESLKKGTEAKKISMQDLKENYKYLKNYNYEEYSSGTKFRNGDTLFARITPSLENGKTAFVNILDENELGFGSTEFYVLRAIQNITNPDYVYYLSRYEKVRNSAIKSMTGTSGRQRVQRAVFDKIIIKLPKLAEQKVIANILSSLDNKIENNNKIINNLEQQNLSYIKKLIDTNEKNVNGRLNDLIDEVISGDWGKATPQGNFSVKSEVIRGADIPKIMKGEQIDLANRYVNKKNIDHKSVRENDIIIEVSGGSPTQSTGRVALIKDRYLDVRNYKILCTNFCKVIRPIEAKKSEYLYWYLRYLYNSNVMFNYENGTTGIKNLDYNTFFSTFPIYIPSEDKLDKFNSKTETLYDMILQLGIENKKLAEIRDALLPKLMSGEIDVRALEEMR